jgi:hypothetical protein
MKKSKAKSKNGHGGARPGAGRRWRWKHQPVKMVRLPVAFLDKILEVVEYIDQHDGQLPSFETPVTTEAAVTTLGYLEGTLSPEELKEFFAREKAWKLTQKVMVGDEEVLVGDETFKELP